MKKVIVTTTINPVTKAIAKFEAMPDWTLVVVGDKKTPKDYRLERGTFVTCEMQEQYDRELSDSIGWNCIQRRNFGLLWAWDMGADVVAVIDDDNIPYPGWGQNLHVGSPTSVNYYASELPVFDPVGAVTDNTLWHRGFPLQYLAKRGRQGATKRSVTPHIQADFWDGDPDIDAICRMEHAPDCRFDASRFPISANVMAPFNSQNTFLTREVLPHYFLYPHIGRMDDIWASYYVQALGYRVVFGAASVFQERNVHDLTKDMGQEILGYQQNHNLIRRLAQDPESINEFLPERSREAWRLFRRHFELGAARA